MTLRPAELLEVAAEVSAAVAGQRVQKVVQPDARTVVLGFPRAWLLVSVDRRFGRVHLLDEKPAGSGEAAPAFCMLLRKELVGARLEAVEAVAGERACAFEFARLAHDEGDGPVDADAIDGAGEGGPRAGEGSKPIRRRLLAFLYGPGARLAFTDESARVIAAIGTPWPAGASVELPSPRAPRPGEPASRFGGPSPSARIAAHYGEAVVQGGSDAVRAEAVTASKQALVRAQRRQQALERDLARVEASAARRQEADLLLAHLREVPRGASEVTLPDDFADGAPRTLRLDPSLSARENAERLYREHKRLQRGRAIVARRLAEARAEAAGLSDRLAALEAATDAGLPSLARTTTPGATPRDARAHARRDDARRPPYRVYASASGAEILVGKGADKNDELTFRVARGNDLFLHVRDFPGSHVIVPLAGRPVDEPTLLDAATLAVYFSSARPKELVPGGGALDSARDDGPLFQADVTYALRKLVRKPRGAAAGRVSVSGGKTLRLRLLPSRLRRLLATRRDD